MKRDKIFISYSHKDRVWLDRLQTVLKPFIREKGLTIWDDRSIKPGDLWHTEIEHALETASVAVMLVSPDFLASDFIASEELPILLQAATSGKLKVCWLLVSACAFETTDLPKFQAAHDPARPLDKLEKADRNQVLTNIARTIATLYEEQAKSAPEAAAKESSASARALREQDAANLKAAEHFISRLLEDETMLVLPEQKTLAKANFFVSREIELGSIHEVFNKCLAEKKNATVIINGDFGTGKTALAGKFFANICKEHSEGLCLVYTQCPKEKHYEGWLPFINLFKLLILKTIQNKTISKRKLARYLLDYCFAWLRLAEPALSSLPGNSTFSQDAIQNQFFKLLKQIGQKQILILVIDDLQWADKSSMGLISYLASGITDSPLFVLSALRPEGLDAGPNAPELRKILRSMHSLANFREIKLPFGLDVEAYILARYHEPILPPTVVKKIQHFSDGQGLYLEHLFAHLEEKQHIIPTDNGTAWKLATSLQLPNIPGSTGEVLDLRLDEMKEDYQNILARASVEGEEFTVQVVARLIQYEEDILIPELSKIGAESRFIAEEGAQDIDVMTFDLYKFTHRFYREHIYSKLGYAERRQFHQAVAFYLEGLKLNKQPLAGKLAYHYLEAHAYEKALVYAISAAKYAHEKGKWLETIDWSKEGLKVIEKLRKNTDNELLYVNEAVEAISIWGRAAEYVGQFSQLWIKLKEFIPQLENREEYELLYARLLLVHAKLHTYENVRGGAEPARRALEIFHKLGDMENELETRYHLAFVLVDNENALAEGIQVFRELIRDSEGNQDVSTVSSYYASLAWSLLYVGYYNEAFTWSRRAYENLVSLPGKNMGSFGFILRVLGRVYFKLGQYSKAVQHQQDSVRIFEQTGDRLEEHWTRFELGTSYIENGDTGNGIAAYNTCLEFAKTIDDFQFQAWIKAELATLEMFNGNYQAAGEQLADVKKLIAEDYTDEDRLDYLIRMAQLHILQGKTRARDVRALLEEAEGLINRHGFEIEMVKVNSLHSEILTQSRKFEEAKSYLDKNIEICQRLDAKVELSDTYEQLGDLQKSIGAFPRGKECYQLALNIRRALAHPHKINRIQAKLESIKKLNR